MEEYETRASRRAWRSVKSAEVRKTQLFPLNLCEGSISVLTGGDGSASVIVDDEDEDDLCFWCLMPDAATVSRIYTAGPRGL